MLHETKIMNAFVLAQLKAHYKALTAPKDNVYISLCSHSLAQSLAPSR